MSSRVRNAVRSTLATLLGAGLVAAPFVAAPAMASPDGTGVIINEAYLKGGSAAAPYNKKFVELYNPGAEAVSLDGWSLQYRAEKGTGASNGVAPLTGSIAAGGYYLVQINGNGANGEALPAPDLDVVGAINPSGTTGTLILADTASALTLPTTALAADAEVDGVVDLLGYGGSNSGETAAAAVDGANGVPNSLARTGFLDTDNNAGDFVSGTPITPQSSTVPVWVDPNAPEEPGEEEPPVEEPGEEEPPVEEPGEEEWTPIAEIQGTGAAIAMTGTVTTRGVVTAAYPTGGFNGYYIQTPGTGGALDLATHTASDGIFVYSPSTVASVAIGDYVEVTGAASDYYDLSQISVTAAADLTVLDEEVAAPVPATVALPADAAQRESLEGMLLAPQGAFTVTDNYDTNYYAEIALASGEAPLITPTEVTRPGSAEYTALVTENAGRAVTIDDGATINFNSTANKGIPLPYLTTAKDTNAPITVGAAVTFSDAVIFDYRNSTWKFQPTQQLTAENAAEVQPVTFSNARDAAVENVGGDIQIASFNVLNYFTTLGDDLAGCTYYTDRTGDPVSVNSGCDARGAAEEEDFLRQQTKIVSAINGLGAEVVSLEEIENSARFGENRDAALETLVDALNADLGSDEWDFVPSPATVPANEDVIRTAFIYKSDAVEPVGSSRILEDAAFANARQPLAQEFMEAGGDEAGSFIAIVNHFKSKGSGEGADADMGDGQGASNASRVAQATALVAFADSLKSEWGTELVFLMGDFNAYSMEDPMQVLYAAGYIDLGALSGEYTYVFDGMVGSLDHILGSPGAVASVTGADVWNINAGESIALEYSRHNYNATILYDESVYRSSDHDPVVVGLDFDLQAVNLLNINDFHGRIDANTLKFAATVEALRAAAGEENTLFLSAGDNIGASLFASSVQQDEPTIDVLNALELATSAVGNHEFDQGFSDLTGRVEDSADFVYLGANVYEKGTTTPVLPEFYTQQLGDLTVGVIGVVTEETPTLVSPGGISTVDFGDPVEAVNRVAAQLSDGDPANGEADIIVAEYHDGAGAGLVEGSTLEEEVAEGGTFAEIVTETSPAVDVIFTGHTHKQYAWDGPVPGGDADETRPIIQTGNYGEFLGQVSMVVDTETLDVVSYVGLNVPRANPTDAQLAAAVAANPRLAEVKTIVDAALAHAAEVGNVEVGTVASDITTAFGGGSYADGVWTGGARDDRAQESALGNLIANALVESLSAEERGGAEIGVVNPGGIRAELTYAPDGSVTYAEANAVLPFVNNLWTTTLTGAQFKTVLEQQWQTNTDGTVPSRPYLALGLSDNVQFTYDETRERGDRVTGIWVDGDAIDPEREYRIGSFNFLLQGGDNFREFANGTDTRDSGLVDRDAWVAFLQANPGLEPDFAKPSARVTGAPETPVALGGEVSFAVSDLDLTSLGSPQNTSVEVTWEGSDAAPVTIPVTGGVADVTTTVPEDLTWADATAVVTAQPSGTVVRVPVPVDVVELNLLNINDFHGRIDVDVATGANAGNNLAVQFAGTVEQLRAEHGEESTLFLSAGDNIGASLFASSSANDEPTLDILNALDLAASAVGNHEFDKGFEDLTGRVTDSADFGYLGANVYLAGTQTPALQEYEVFMVDGISVAVIGTVTQETPSLVSPDYVADLTFGDPVDAVNRVAAQLSDGDAGNGEADVIIAEYHEGAGAGIPDGSTLEEEVADGGAFAKIVTQTSVEVDAIFTGHTHKQYAWDAPVPGVEGATRPLLQTGSYGEFIGQIVLAVDPETRSVIAYEQENVARTTVPDATLVAEFPRVAEVATIVDAALAEAAVIGNVPKGEVTADITTAYAGGSFVDGVWTGGSRDDRASESTLGNLVADSLVASLSSEDRGGAEIGVVNPGGLRAELLFAPDGTITYAEANAVLPFVNNLWTTSLTGAQFKQVLEEQWQTNADGTIPSRPFLKLGLSENVRYTYDDSRAQGDRITGIWIDGAPIDPAASYRIGSFNFLLQGGDNFRTFAQGTDTRDSGLVDRDAWIEYLEQNSPISPSFDKRGVKVTGAPASAEEGSTVSFTVSNLDLTSLGSPANTSLEVSWSGSTAEFAPVAVTAGSATVSLTVPADAPASSTIELMSSTTGTTVSVPLTIAEPGVDPEPEMPSTPPVAVPDTALTPDKENVISVSDATLVPGQTITIYVGTQYAGQWVSVWMYSTPVLLGGGWQQVSAAGTVTVAIPADAPAGTHRIVVLDASGAVIGWTTVTVAGPAGAGSNGSLTNTGGDIAPLVTTAALLLGLGLVLTVSQVRRRRRSA